METASCNKLKKNAACRMPNVQRMENATGSCKEWSCAHMTTAQKVPMVVDDTSLPRQK